MKKILSILCLFFFGTQGLFATCEIANREADPLKEYFEYTNKALNTVIRTAPSQKRSNIQAINQAKRISDAVVFGYNYAFDFSYFFSDFKYNLEFPKEAEMPKELKRDYEKLKKYHEKIKDTYEKLIKTKDEDGKIEDFCASLGLGADTDIYCNIEKNITANDLMAIIAKNHNRAKYVFEQSVGGNQSLEEYVQFAPKDFIKQMQKSYGPKAIESCNKENGFGKKVSEKTTAISRLENENKDAIQVWKNAWKLLVGADDTNYRQRERELLRGELSRQGVGSDDQSSMLDNLARFNISGFSENNNYFTNTFKGFERKIENETEVFNRETIEKYLEEHKETGVGITETMNVEKEAEVKKNIVNDLATMHASLELYAGKTQKTTSNLSDQLINSHLEISESINTLIGTCEKAVILCNRQASSKGNCGSCN